MTINLITEKEHDQLLEIFEEFPKLTLQNKGYEYIGKNKLTEIEKTKITEIESILKRSIHGFSSFTNFKLDDKTQEIKIRLQYDYASDGGNGAHHFIGVGYILLDELLNGFKN